MTLEHIAEHTTYPKASVSRMLETLCDLNLIERNSQTKNYHAIARIHYSEKSTPDFSTRVQQELETLSSDLCVTAEWFEPSLEGLVLRQRASPLEAEVVVIARSGFVREWNGELDSVASLGYALYRQAPEKATSQTLWVYGLQGEHLALKEPSVRKILKTAAEEKQMIDTNFNNHGVKRVACAVMHDHELKGILSLALTFTPVLELEIKKNLAALKSAAETLENYKTIKL